MNILVLKAAAFAGLVSASTLLIWLKLQEPLVLLYAGLFLLAAIGVAVIGLFIKDDRIKY